jgi:thymidylate synthase
MSLELQNFQNMFEKMNEEKKEEEKHEVKKKTKKTKRKEMKNQIQWLIEKVFELEKKVQELEKFKEETKNNRKTLKKEINWNGYIPICEWNEYKKYILISDKEIDYFIDKKMVIDTILYIIENKNKEVILPICCLKEKKGLMYGYDNKKWILFEKEKQILFYEMIVKKLLFAFEKWINKKEEELKRNDQLDIHLNKLIIKLMDFDVKKSFSLHKLNHCIYNKINKEMKDLPIRWF